MLVNKGAFKHKRSSVAIYLKTIRVPNYLFEDFRSIFNVDVFPHTIDVLPDGKINSNSAIIINGTPESENDW